METYIKVNDERILKTIEYNLVIDKSNKDNWVADLGYISNGKFYNTGAWIVKMDEKLQNVLESHTAIQFYKPYMMNIPSLKGKTLSSEYEFHNLGTSIRIYEELDGIPFRSFNYQFNWNFREDIFESEKKIEVGPTTSEINEVISTINERFDSALTSEQMDDLIKLLKGFTRTQVKL